MSLIHHPGGRALLKFAACAAVGFLATFLEKVAPKYLAPDTGRVAWSRSDAGRKLPPQSGGQTVRPVFRPTSTKTACRPGPNARAILIL